MSDSIAERMDAGWQAARHWETECETARAECDGHLETIRETFRVLESRGQAPDDNAPLEVTVRRVLDHLASVTAERDSWRQVHQTALDHAEERENHHAETVARLTAERDALAAERDNLKARVELLEAYSRADATSALYVGTERDALAAQLAALKKRLADAPRKMLYPRDEGEKTAWVAHLPLEDGE